MKKDVLWTLKSLALLTLLFLGIQTGYAYLTDIIKKTPTSDKHDSKEVSKRKIKLTKQKVRPAKSTEATNDPIRFTIRSSTPAVEVGKEFDLTVTAQLLNISPNSMFFLPGSNAYTLKMLLPTGFQQTGGDLTEFVAGELSLPAKPEATYTIRGYFKSREENACFRLLKSHQGATNQSLFEVRSTLCLPFAPTLSQGAARTESFSWCVEAETGSGTTGTSSSGQASGGQYTGNFGNSSDYKTYSITGVPSAGSYTLHLWYASGESPIFGIVVNAGALQTASGPGNSAWAGPFIEKTLTISLQAGSNTLKIQGAGGAFTLDRLCVDGGSVCQSPTLSLSTPTCTGTTSYSIGFTAQSGATVTSSAGTVVGSGVVNIPTTTNVTVTASLGGCSAQQAATAPTCSSQGGCAASISGITYTWDGGNNSITIKITSSANAPQVMWSGASTIGWTNTYANSGVWQWAQVGMNIGNYSVSVRPQGDSGAGCSFNFTVPGSGTLYPTGCTPPSAPALSAPTGTTVCNGSTVALNAGNCSGTLNWSTGQMGSSINVGAGTYTATCTQNGCISPSSSIVVTNCTGCTISYSRVMLVGNSITHHSATSDWAGGTRDWGMDATAPEKDYKHILTAYLKGLNSNVDVREFASFSSSPVPSLGTPLSVGEGPNWEAHYWELNANPVFSGGLERYNAIADWKPELIIMRLSENISNSSHDLPTYYKQLIDKLKSQNPSCTVILTTSVWNQADVSSIITAVGAERGYPVANLNNISGAQVGYGGHPNDAAMQVIADRIWAIIPKCPN